MTVPLIPCSSISVPLVPDSLRPLCGPDSQEPSEKEATKSQALITISRSDLDTLLPMVSVFSWLKAITTSVSCWSASGTRNKQHARPNISYPIPLVIGTNVGSDSLFSTPGTGHGNISRGHRERKELSDLPGPAYRPYSTWQQQRPGQRTPHGNMPHKSTHGTTTTIRYSSANTHNPGDTASGDLRLQYMPGQVLNNDSYGRRRVGGGLGPRPLSRSPVILYNPDGNYHVQAATPVPTPCFQASSGFRGTKRPGHLSGTTGSTGRSVPSEPVSPTTLRDAVFALHASLAHTHYAVCGLAALCLHGFAGRNPRHVSILCPGYARESIAGWMLATAPRPVVTEDVCINENNAYGGSSRPRRASSTRAAGLRDDTMVLELAGGRRCTVRVKYIQQGWESLDLVALRGEDMPETVTDGPRVLSLVQALDFCAHAWTEEMAKQMLREHRSGNFRYNEGNTNRYEQLAGDTLWTLHEILVREEHLPTGYQTMLPLTRHTVPHVVRPLFWRNFVRAYPEAAELFSRAGLPVVGDQLLIVPHVYQYDDGIEDDYVVDRDSKSGVDVFTVAHTTGSRISSAATTANSATASSKEPFHSDPCHLSLHAVKRPSGRRWLGWWRKTAVPRAKPTISRLRPQVLGSPEFVTATF